MAYVIDASVIREAMEQLRKAFPESEEVIMEAHRSLAQHIYYAPEQPESTKVWQRMIRERKN